MSEFKKPIWEIAVELGESIPKEERDAFPKDGAQEHDHYLYGWEKSKTAEISTEEAMAIYRECFKRNKRLYELLAE